MRDAQAMKEVAAGCEIVYHLAGKAHALTEVRGNEDAYREGSDGNGGESCSRVSAHGGPPYETLRVFARMKSIGMNCPSVIVFVNTPCRGISRRL